LQGVACALVGDIIRHIGRHHARHDQNRVDAQRLRQAQLLATQLQRLFAHFRVGVRERLLPVDACRERAKFHADGVGVAANLLRVRIAGRGAKRALEVHVELYRVEARLLHHAQAGFDIPVAWQCPAVNPYLERRHIREVRVYSDDSYWFTSAE
jgi:hypothetical protein